MTLAAHDFHMFRSTVGSHVLLVDGSRIYDVDASFEQRDPASQASMLVKWIPEREVRYIDDVPLQPPAITALSLNVAQTCNLACTYCYADEGRFGAKAQRMTMPVAREAVRLLLTQAGAGGRAVLGFMGGEPLINRALIHAIVPEAVTMAAEAGVALQFSLTTNATLVNEEDASLFHEHRFTVAVSLDGDAAVNDLTRPTVKGRSSYAMSLEGLSKLLSVRPGHLSVRATVTPGAVDLPGTLDHLIALGVDEVGFSPVLTSPSGTHEFSAADFEPFLRAMIMCGERAKAALLSRRRYPFGNFETALHEIDRGTHRPYPCGAGAGYASVSSSGALYACHRAINDSDFAMGSLASGPDQFARARFLTERHVSRQLPCTTCWARQLCGGGCHQEVARRGRVHCDYVRGWLSWCLSAYAEMSERASGYFADPERWFTATPFQERANVK